ncbi:hypothetical protein MGSAQ_000579 [marine sediment metagenome]|uniref:Uncharacterized protein n=1 Tax=marine sediment metagenome TaxID=412755 RepID=A0A1B6NYN5_9ZZZZ
MMLRTPSTVLFVSSETTNTMLFSYRQPLKGLRIRRPFV